MPGLPTPARISTKQARIATLARQLEGTALRSLFHHVDLAWMVEAYRRTRKNGASGVDGQTAADFERNLEENLQRLLDDAKSGRYRALPVRQVLIPKPGGTRPIISPLLANVYLHEALDRWWTEEVLPRLRGRAVLIRYADDFIIAFAEQRDAERVQKVLPHRLRRFGLILHPDKTRLISFERPSQHGGGPQPGTFDFLGFTFHWARSRRGFWALKTRTARTRFSRALRAVSAWVKRHRHDPIPHQAARLAAILRGHCNYYGVPGNAHALGRFRYEVLERWRRALARRSQRYLTWMAFKAIVRRHPLPPARMPPWKPRQLRLANV